MSESYEYLDPVPTINHIQNFFGLKVFRIARSGCFVEFEIKNNCRYTVTTDMLSKKVILTIQSSLCTFRKIYYKNITAKN